MKILILGGGPTGLALGTRLKENGFNSFLILEKEKEAGGLCRTVKINDTPVDIGGPHFLDERNTKVVDYLFRFLPKNEWDFFERNSKIMLSGGKIVGSPIEANIWQLNKDEQLEYLESISTAGCNIGSPMPEKFVDWIYWKLGNQIAENYMLPYNTKLYGENLDEMGTYWLYKLPSVSFRETLMSCLDRKEYGKQPCQSHFYYSTRYGSGEVWRRMAESINDHICYNTCVKYIDLDTCIVKDSNEESYSADIIITTIPWSEFTTIDGLPAEILSRILSLKSISLEVKYVKEEFDTDAQWMYCADKDLPYHRVTMMKNLNPNAHGMLMETNQRRTALFQGSYPSLYSNLNLYAYPVHTIEKPMIMAELFHCLKNKNVIAIGRWGEHQQHNSDTVVDLALKLADKITI